MGAGVASGNFGIGIGIAFGFAIDLAKKIQRLKGEP